MEINEQQFFGEAFSRNIGLLSKKEQEKLRQSTVVVAGMGGVGGIEVVGLARLGIGGFRIADPDTFELANFNRQIGATMQSIGKSKAETLKKMILDINPYARVEVFPAIDEGNVEAFLSGADIAVDGIDFFSPEVRRIFYGEARKQGIFVVSAGPIGFGSASLVFDPKGMSFDEYFDIQDGMSEEMMAMKFGIGLTPSLLQRTYFHPDKVDFKGKSGASLVIGTFFAAGLVLTFVVKLLLKKEGVPRVPRSLHFDPYVGKLKKPYLPFGNRGWLQRIKLKVALFLLRKIGKASKK